MTEKRWTIDRERRSVADRRKFLRFGLITLAAASFPSQLTLAVAKPLSSRRSLAFYQTHTGEKLEACYWRDGRYVPSALTEIDFILRDHRTGDIMEIDRALLDLLHTLGCSVDASKPWHIISGFRSSATNTSLRNKSGGVASGSLHLQGKAADIRLPGCDLSTLRKAALEMRGGGVGYYPGSDFVHVDVGRIRQWTG